MSVKIILGSKSDLEAGEKLYKDAEEVETEYNSRGD